MPVFVKVLCTFLLALCFHNQVLSHEGRPVYVQVNVGASGLYDVRWKIPPVMPAGEEPTISVQGRHCEPLQANPRPSLSGQSQYSCDPSPKEAVSVVLTYANNNPALSSLIHLNKHTGESFSLFNGPDTLQINLPNQVSFFDVAKQYVQGGFQHILSGFDHLLFVLCLMQIALGTRNLIMTITGFTVGHSITLAMSSLGWVSVRIDVVEVLISLSIVMLILEITKAKIGKPSPSLIWRYPALISLGFGLLHGFGFASALGDLGLPQAMKIPALAFFNVGVELGQLAFVGCVLLMLKVFSVGLKKYSNNQQTQVMQKRMEFPMVMLYAIGAISSYWFIDRSISLFI